VARLDPGVAGSFAISPDGREVAYTLGGASKGLFVRSLSGFETRRIEGAENASLCCFSADGRELAFIDARAHVLYALSLSGGSPRPVLETDEWMPFLWMPDGSFLLTGAKIDGRSWRGLARVDADGKNVRKVTTVRSEGEVHASPRLLPGGRRVVFTIVGTSDFDAGIVDLEGGEYQLLAVGSTPMFVEPDILLTYDAPSRRVEAIHLDPETGMLRGDPWVVLPNVDRGRDGLGDYTVASDGTLAYVPADPGAAAFRGNELVWFDGHDEQPIGRGELGSWTQPRLSPDDSRLLVRMTSTPDCSLWLFDLERGSRTRLTFELDTHNPLWHPDGKHVLFSGEPEGMITQVMLQPADGSSPAVPLRSGVTEAEVPRAVSSEGELLAFTRAGKETQTDIWVVPLAGGEPRPFAVTRFDEDYPSFSPDGKWIAYASDETGRDEVYVRAWPSGGAKVQVSVDGGTSPRFSRDGRRLFFAIDTDLWVADVEADSSFRASLPRLAFHGDFVFERLGNWDVSADGTRAVFVRGSHASGERELRVVYDWTATLAGE